MENTSIKSNFRTILNCGKKKRTLLKINIPSFLTIDSSATSYISNTDRLDPVLVHSQSLNCSQPRFFSSPEWGLCYCYLFTARVSVRLKWDHVCEMFCKPYSTSRHTRALLVWVESGHGHANGLERTRSCCLVTHVSGIKTAMGIQLDIALLRGETLLCPSWLRQGAASWRRPATLAKFHKGRKIHHVDWKDRIVSGFGFFFFL